MLRLIMTGLFFLMILLFFADLLLGSTHLAAGDVIKSLFGQGTPHGEIIVMQFRLPKALTAIIAGAAMSVSGLLMQTLFRNPLAGPDVLGVSSGAGLGVALTVLTITPLFSFARLSPLASPHPGGGKRTLGSDPAESGLSTRSRDSAKYRKRGVLLRCFPAPLLRAAPERC